MPKKPIIDVEVNSEKFDAFVKKYEKWLGSNEHTLEKLKSFTNAISGMAEAFDVAHRHAQALHKELGNFHGLIKDAGHSTDQLAEKTDGVTNAVDKSRKSMSYFSSAVQKSSSAFKHIQTTTGHIFKNVLKTGDFMLKLGLIGGGVGAFAGLFGFTKLAENSVEGQRKARGLGLNQGQTRAFDVDFKNFVPPGMLGNIASLKTQPAELAKLAYSLHMPYQKALTMPVDQLAIRAIGAARQWWTNTPPAQRMEQTPQLQSFEAAGLQTEDIRRLAHTSPLMLARARTQYQKDQRTLAVSPGDTNALYGFTRQLNLSKNTLETFLARQLHSAAPAIAHLIKALTKDVEHMIQIALTPKNLQSITSGIEDAAKFLGSKEFMQDMDNFKSAIVDLTTMIEKTAHFFGIGVPQVAGPPQRKDVPWSKQDKRFMNPIPGIGGHKVIIENRASGLAFKQANSASK